MARPLNNMYVLSKEFAKYSVSPFNKTYVLTNNCETLYDVFVHEKDLFTFFHCRTFRISASSTYFLEYFCNMCWIETLALLLYRDKDMLPPMGISRNSFCMHIHSPSRTIITLSTIIPSHLYKKKTNKQKFSKTMNHKRGKNINSKTKENNNRATILRKKKKKRMERVK